MPGTVNFVVFVRELTAWMAFRGASVDGQAADGVTSKQRRTNRRKRKKIDEIVR
jgi:hypothetical protein